MTLNTIPDQLHHGTTRKYTAGLINLFNQTEVQYTLSDGSLKTVKVPLSFSAREKYALLEELSEAQYLNGNTNMLPVGYLALTGLNKSLERSTNKNSKIHKAKSTVQIEYMYNSVPYDFDYELTYICRGMNEATQIIEQLVVLFTPNYYIDINDVSNLTEPTRVPIKLNDVQFETEEHDTLSSNIVTVRFGLTLVGNLYMPIKRTEIIREYDLSLNTIQNESEATKTSMMEWDVVDGKIV